MQFKEYLKEQKELLLAIISSEVIMHLVIFASNPLNMSLGEILYMDFLMLGILVGGIGLHYRKMKDIYNKIIEGINEEKDLIGLIEDDTNIFGIQLVESCLVYEKKQFSQIENAYQEKMNTLQDYMTQVTHDIKVNVAAQEMLVGRLEIQEDDVSSFKLQIEKQKFLINQLLYVARANCYDEDILSETIEVSHVMKEAIKNNVEFLMAKDISLEVMIKPYELLSDTKWVLYIFTQILHNSSKYTAEGGEIKIWNEEDDKAYYIHIRDNGIGIPKEELKRIFDQGFTGTNGRIQTKATGMGLYYAKKMANLLGIGFDIKSKRGNYTECIVIFYKLSDYFKMTEMSF